MRNAWWPWPWPYCHCPTGGHGLSALSIQRCVTRTYSMYWYLSWKRHGHGHFTPPPPLLHPRITPSYAAFVLCATVSTPRASPCHSQFRATLLSKVSKALKY
ncbi:hypothetical protein K466DRAFT_25794 [Polyporus arcularius HHB13444]|uniref:Uncharacterized protein n=1 Tax=Polyporus arcularius HHB13444 TaxID=1314778 RepID=A0A5C3PIU6_9APHY|nr:hypothetical protein K466DRAFT_25794 [Polyporus arcularius HHB13444]